MKIIRRYFVYCRENREIKGEKKNWRYFRLIFDFFSI